MKYCKSAKLDLLQPLPEPVTFCATVSESGEEYIVTDLMIRRACEQAEDMQIWPYSQATSAQLSNATVIKGLSAMQSAVVIPFPTRVSQK